MPQLWVVLAEPRPAADDRLRPGRQRQHRRVRRPARDRRRRPRAGAWLHVDGAFGLWAAASPRHRHLVDGVELADSWACDGHKWLNVPYDSGYAFCAHPDVHRAAMAYTAAYLTGQVAGRAFGGGDFVAGVVSAGARFRDLGGAPALGRPASPTSSTAAARMARRFAERLDALDGVEVVNDVVLNQVLVRVGDDAR